MKQYIGAIDQGTTSTRFVIFDKNSRIIGYHQLEHTQIYPQAGWVEHDPMEIKDNVFRAVKEALNKCALKSTDLAAIGITNQRETTLLWNKKSGKPYYNAIVWQDTRTGEYIRSIARNGDMDCFREKTGLPLATYFSGPKIRWLLDYVPEVREDIKKGDVLFGTIDSWVTWWLSGGPEGGVHITDITNAGRTLLMDLKSLNWDPEMLEIMNIPASILPAIKSSSEIYGYTAEAAIGGKLPIAGILGDQQAALFGQVCFEEGEVKNTYGTGAFCLMNTGSRIPRSRYGLITTPAYKLGQGAPVYALEGSIAIAGSLVQWFRDNLGMITTSGEIELLARSVENSGGVYIVPAFSGLFAPYWRSDARGVIVGLTHYINKGHLARAVLEATAYQTAEIFEAMQKDTGLKVKSLKVDGGMVVNDLLMQFQADMLDTKVIRPQVTETTVLGAAYAAGLAVGFWDSQEELKEHWAADKHWSPTMTAEERDARMRGWSRAVERSFNLGHEA